MSSAAIAPVPFEPAARARAIGRVVSVTGFQAVVMLDHQAIRDARAELGTLLKIDTPKTMLLGLVSALSVPVPAQKDGEPEVRIAEVELMGELPKLPDGSLGAFLRGVSTYPGLGDPVHIASVGELKRVYRLRSDDQAVHVGTLLQDASIPAMVDVDGLLGKHCAVLGSTGTGKSCGVALMLRAILQKNPQAHILLLDPHSEYASSFGRAAEIITPSDLQLPFWFLTFEEMLEVVLGGQVAKDAEVDILAELIPAAKWRYAASRGREAALMLKKRVNEMGSFTVDTPVPYRISDLIALIDERMGRLENKRDLAPYRQLKARIEAISQDPRYTFMFGSLTVQDQMSGILGRLFRVPVNAKPIAILELTGVPSEVTNVVVSVICRMTFDFALWSEGDVPITLVCEEAHRYVPSDPSVGFEPTKRAIARIAKEGRKYGVSLCVVSQRPAELDPTILSQCNTIFAMRMTNERDQEIVKAAIFDAAASLLDFLPSLGTREAIVSGEGVSLPARIRFDDLPEAAMPRGRTASFTDKWRHDTDAVGFLDAVVGRWRAAGSPTPYVSEEQAADAMGEVPDEWDSPEPQSAPPVEQAAPPAPAPSAPEPPGFEEGPLPGADRLARLAQRLNEEQGRDPGPSFGGPGPRPARPFPGPSRQ